MEWLKKNNTALIFTLIAGGTGFLYWDIWGCTDGCMIRSNPYLMILYGLLIGYWIGDFIQKYINNKKQNENIQK